VGGHSRGVRSGDRGEGGRDNCNERNDSVHSFSMYYIIAFTAHTKTLMHNVGTVQCTVTYDTSKYE